jgi:periplasmic protein TonB
VTRAEFDGASPNAHLLIGELPAPHQFGSSWRGTGLSIAAHIVVLGLMIYAATHVPQVVDTARALTPHFTPVFPNRPGAGDRGGSAGTTTSDPARRAERAATRPREITPTSNPADTPAREFEIPVTAAQPIQVLPGALTPIDPTSAGIGRGSRAGDGGGPGIGQGDGPGVGDGRVGGFGGDGFPPGGGVTPPRLIKEVKPNYTGDAMRAKLQGVVEMEALVLADGSVDPGGIRITRSLDAALGLDQQAIIAVKQWRFRPGTYRGQPVAMRVNVELTFTLR